MEKNLEKIEEYFNKFCRNGKVLVSAKFKRAFEKFLRECGFTIVCEKEGGGFRFLNVNYDYD